MLRNMMFFFLILIPWRVRVVAGIGPPRTCCEKLTKPTLRITDIISYTNESDALCPVKGIRFLTTNNKIYCYDPERSWTKRAMAEIDNRTTPKPPPTIPPTWTSTTSSMYSSSAEPNHTSTTSATQTLSTKEAPKTENKPSAWTAAPKTTLRVNNEDTMPTTSPAAPKTTNTVTTEYMTPTTSPTTPKTTLRVNNEDTMPTTSPAPPKTTKRPIIEDTTPTSTISKFSHRMTAQKTTNKSITEVTTPTPSIASQTPGTDTEPQTTSTTKQPSQNTLQSTATQSSIRTLAKCKSSKVQGLPKRLLKKSKKGLRRIQMECN